MKKRSLIVSLIASILFVCFLLATNQSYKFRQEFDQIVKIEILKKDTYGYDTSTAVEVLKTLDTTEHRAFIDNFMKVEGFRIGSDPPSGFGTYVIRITYRNGETELISDYNNGYVSADGIVHIDNSCMEREQFYDFL